LSLEAEVRAMTERPSILPSAVVSSSAIPSLYGRFVESSPTFVNGNTAMEGLEAATAVARGSAGGRRPRTTKYPAISTTTATAPRPAARSTATGVRRRTVTLGGVATPSSAGNNSRALSGRCAGSFARQRAMSAATASGTSARTSATGRAVVPSCAAATWCGGSP
jgi:hypothetical protein